MTRPSNELPERDPYFDAIAEEEELDDGIDDDWDDDNWGDDNWGDDEDDFDDDDN